MHRSGSPLPSGRSAMWKCLPILMISPILTVFVRGWDLLIYLLVVYTFTASLLISFRRLCHEWTDWHIKVPNFKEKDLLTWYRKHASVDSDADATALAGTARYALQQEIIRVQRQKRSWAFWNRSKDTDPFVMKMADGMKFADFLLRKDASAGEPPELFTTTWFVQLELALDNQRQLMRGLKEHSSFINYRYSRYDVSNQSFQTFPSEALTLISMLAWSERRLVPRRATRSSGVGCHVRARS